MYDLTEDSDNEGLDSKTVDDGGEIESETDESMKVGFKIIREVNYSDPLFCVRNRNPYRNVILDKKDRLNKVSAQMKESNPFFFFFLEFKCTITRSSKLAEQVQFPFESVYPSSSCCRVDCITTFQYS